MNNISLFEAARLLLHYDNYGILILISVGDADLLS